MIRLTYLAFNNFFGRSSLPVEPEPETIAFINRVVADGGKVLDEVKLNNFYKINKHLGKYNALQFAVSKQFGYKVVGGNIVKIYDTSSNQNDLVLATGSVPENAIYDMFFLLDSYFVTSGDPVFSIGAKFSFHSKINHPNPQANTLNHIFGVNGLNIIAGGSSYSRSLLYTTDTTSTYFRSQPDRFNNVNDANVNRTLWYRHSTDQEEPQRIYKDSVNAGINSNQLLEHVFDSEILKIVYGSNVFEHVGTSADCYLNDTFFYNDYLTDEELEAINNI